MTYATYFTNKSSGIKIADIWHPTNPTELLTPSDLCEPSPPKRPKLTRHSTQKKTASLLSNSDVPASISESEISGVVVSIPLTFQQIDRDFKVRFYTGLPNTDVFRAILKHPMKKAEFMEYWEGPAKALTSAFYENSVFESERTDIF